MSTESFWGIAVVACMLASYTLRRRGQLFNFAFFLVWAAASAYLLWQGAFLFGALQGVFALLALHRWYRGLHDDV